jgi:predicted site-specific integrase-resolvase
MPHDELIGTAEAAGILGKSLPTVKRYAMAGRLPVAVKMKGDTGAYLFERADVDRLAAELAAGDEPAEATA